MFDLRKSSERHHCLDRSNVGGMHRSGTAQLALVLGCLLGKNMALERLTPLDGAATANLEALRSAFLGFHLGHDDRTLVMHMQVATKPDWPHFSEPDICFLWAFPFARNTHLLAHTH